MKPEEDTDTTEPTEDVIKWAEENAELIEENS